MSSKVYLATKDDLGALQTTGVGVGEVGVVTWQYTLLANHMKLDGTTVLGAEYPLLLAFAVNHALVTTDVDNKVLFKYDAATDVLTLPDFTDLVLQGGAAVEQMAAGLPNITGRSPYAVLPKAWGDQVGADKYYRNEFEYSISRMVHSGDDLGNSEFSASRCNPVYGNSSTVQPPAVKLIPQIRYAADAAMSLMDMVGHVLYDVVLRDGFIKANGAAVEYASTAVPRLVAFVREHPELLGDGPALYKYAEAEDTLTLPNFTARVLQGGDSVTAISAGLPNITGQLWAGVGTTGATDSFGAFRNATGMFYPSESSAYRFNTNTGTKNTNNTGFMYANADASRSNSIYGASSTVQPPAITLIPQIKY